MAPSTDAAGREQEAGETTTTITATTHLVLPAHPTPLSYEELNPRSEATDFLGPWGTLGVSVIAPFWAYFVYFACNERTGCHPRSASAWADSFSGYLNEWPVVAGQLWDWQAVGVYLAWYAFCVVCAFVLPGEKVQGSLMRDGHRKTYTMNGGYSAVDTDMNMDMEVENRKAKADERLQHSPCCSRPVCWVPHAARGRGKVHMALRPLDPSGLCRSGHVHNPGDLGLGIQLLLPRAPR